VGARKRDILQQLLAESLGLSVLSGGLGVVGSLILTYGSYYLYPTFDMRAPVWILVPAFTMAIVVGVIFGVVPAWKASRIETLEALRYE
jgi:putative ABC transport system permease protein